MNTEALARQHGKPVQEQNAEVEYLFTLEGVEALLAAEREACAQIVDHILKEGGCTYGDAIRARSNP